jgi:hypothetical protein
MRRLPPETLQNAKICRLMPYSLHAEGLLWKNSAIHIDNCGVDPKWLMVA